MKTIVKAFLAVTASMATLAACAPVNVLNGITPSGSFSKTKNVSFGDASRQKMDIYIANEPRENSPVIMFVHGGSWDSGSKDIYKFLAEGFTQEGFDVVVPNYRLYPEVRYPTFIEDNALAVAQTAKRFPNRPIALMGHSAGGYNVLMLGLVPKYLEAVGVDRCSQIAGIAALSAPVGVVPLDSEPLITAFPDRFAKDDAPLNVVDGPAPQMFLANGQEDTTVYPDNAVALGKKITERGGAAQVKIYPD
ncbi:MAG: alpha/beta hydrolase, partial [Litorimonas sp.]